MMPTIAVAHDWHALDPLCFQQCRNVAQIGLLGHGDDITRHDVLDRIVMRIGTKTRAQAATLNLTLAIAASH
jgi:hypothetical protein